MKKLIFILAFFVVYLSANAQKINKDTLGLNLPVINNDVVYTGVVEANGKTKDQLFRNAQQWLIEYFFLEKNVIQNKDQENGLVYGNGVVALLYEKNYYLPWSNHFTVKIECKDNKYRYTFYNMAIHVIDKNDTSIYDFKSALAFLLGVKTDRLPGTVNVLAARGTAKNVFKSNDVQMRQAIASLQNAMKATPADF